MLRLKPENLIPSVLKFVKFCYAPHYPEPVCMHPSCWDWLKWVYVSHLVSKIREVKWPGRDNPMTLTFHPMGIPHTIYLAKVLFFCVMAEMHPSCWDWLKWVYVSHLVSKIREVKWPGRDNPMTLTFHPMGIPPHHLPSKSLIFLCDDWNAW